MATSHGYCAVRGNRNRNRQIYQTLLLAASTMFVMALAAPTPILAQAEHQGGAEVSFLPPTIGEPLTIKPLDMQDIDCLVASWAPTAKRPEITLICPPLTVFAPIRVLIKLSWMKPEDAPITPEHIFAPTGTLTKIRTKKTLAEIWLPVGKERNDAPRGTWVGFNAVVDVALLRGRPR
jgi:hypothetical protein